MTNKNSPHTNNFTKLKVHIKLLIQNNEFRNVSEVHLSSKY